MSEENRRGAETQRPEEKLAFIVTVEGDMDTIVFATTASKAKFIAFRGYREAGYGHAGTWPSMRVGRVPRLDKSALRNQPPKCWTPEYAEGTA